MELRHVECQDFTIFHSSLPTAGRQLSHLWGLQKEDPKKTFIYLYQVVNLFAGIAKRIQIAAASPHNDVNTISGSSEVFKQNNYNKSDNPRTQFRGLLATADRSRNPEKNRAGRFGN